MIWMQRQDRLSRDWSDWHPWFAWRPIEIRHMSDKPENGVYIHTYYHAWLQTILRKREGGYWRYKVSDADWDELKMKADAVRLAPKYAKQILLMDKTGG